MPNCKPPKNSRAYYNPDKGIIHEYKENKVQAGHICSLLKRFVECTQNECQHCN